jgi:hypothetical protein
LLNGTYGFVDLGSLTWDGATTGTPYRFNAGLPLLKTQVTSVVGNLLTKYYTAVSYNDSGSMDKIICGYTAAAGQKIRIQDYSYIGLTPEQFKIAMSGVYLIYELAEPSTPVTPEQFATLCQAFGITGNTYQITFGQTVYSANLDVLNGKLIITHELKTIDENSDIQRADNGILYLNSFFEIGEDTESVNCNVYQRGENRGTVAQVNANNPDLSFCCKLGTNTDRIMIKDTRFTTLEDYKTWLSTNPVKIAVKLAEPIEIQLTPTQIITTLIGENVIFADVADVTECKYKKI